MRVSFNIPANKILYATSRESKYINSLLMNRHMRFLYCGVAPMTGLYIENKMSLYMKDTYRDLLIIYTGLCKNYLALSMYNCCAVTFLSSSVTISWYAPLRTAKGN